MTELVVHVSGSNPANVAQFENWLGRPVDGVLAYTAGSSPGDWNGPDPEWQLDSSWLGGSGRKLYWSIPMAPDDAGVAQYREIAAGMHNAEYTEWAQKILASRGGDSDPIYVRTTWELGGEWFPWTAVAQEDPEAFKAAFQQFAKAFHDVSGRFQMVWDFIGDRGPVEQWYPGDEAVDVISQDIYWQPVYAGPDPETGFEWNATRARGLDWMAEFAAQHGKPMAISEWGVSGDDGGPFIKDMQEWIATHNVAYVTFWNDGDGSGYNGEISSGRWPNAGQVLKEFWAALDGGGDQWTPAPEQPQPESEPEPEPSAPTDTAAIDIGAGADSLVLRISQDFYQGSAEYTVRVDGEQVGGTLTAVALHGAGQSDTVTVRGHWGYDGPRTVTVDYLNDLWDGTPETDRNLHVDGATYNGTTVEGAGATLYPAGPYDFVLNG